MKPGDTLDMTGGPWGDFVLPKDAKIPLTFIAGGIGVTPMRSMVKWLSDQDEKRDITLLYAVNNLDEVVFEEIFTNFGIEPQYIVGTPSADWQGESGRLNGQKILELSPDNGKRLYFISGPEPMVVALADQLKKLGIPESRVVIDDFLGYDTDAQSLFQS